MQLTSLIFNILAADPAPAGEQSIPDKLGLSLTGLGLQALGFGILMFVLFYFAYRPLLKVLDERRFRAQEIVDKSDQIRRDLSDTEARNRAEFERARTEAQAIIVEAQATKDRIVAEAREAAQTAAQAETEKARAEIRAERAAAVAQLRRETADLAINAATRIVGHELQGNKTLQMQIINEVLANPTINKN